MSIIKLGDSTWEEIHKLDKQNTVIIIPTGSIEQHGPHLPLKTDSFIISEIAFRKKGFFVSSDLKSQTNLSDKSIERYIKVLVDKGFFYIKQGRDKRIKQFHPSKDLERHMRATWEVRIKQIETVLKMSSKYEEVLRFLKQDKYPW